MRGVLSSAGFPAVAGRLPGVAPGSPAARQRSSARDIPRFKLQRRSFGSQVGWLRGRKAEAAALRPEADQRWAALEEAEKLRGLRGYENNLAGMTIDYSDDLEDRLTSTLEQKPPAGGFQFSDDPSKVFRRTRTELITEVWQDIKELALLSLSSDAVPTRDGYEGLERLKYKVP